MYHYHHFSYGPHFPFGFFLFCIVVILLAKAVRS